MKKGILVAGNLIIDIIKTIEAYPQRLSLTAIKGVERSFGGAVCNCAMDLARLDPFLPVTALGAVGADDFGQSILERFSAYPNLNRDFIITRGQTSFTDVMTEEATGNRTFFTYKGADSTLTPEDIPWEKLEGDLFHIGYIMLLNELDKPDGTCGTVMARLLRRAQREGFRTSVDVVTESGSRYKTLVPPALKYTDYFCINETEAQNITDIPLEHLDGEVRRDRFRRACEALKGMGVGRWAVIHSPEYCAGLDEENNFRDLVTIPLPPGFIKGSVGAGDAFVSGLLYGVYRGMALEEALRLGEATAVSSLSEKGGTEGVGTLEEVTALYERLGGKLRANREF